MYILEGNVGAGKSTLLQLIGKHLQHINVVTEPVDVWSKEGCGNSLLAHFYEDTTRWGYTMETYTLFIRVQEHMRVAGLQYPFKMMERSLYSGNYCFARNGYVTGAMSSIEWQVYTKWFDYLVTQRCPVPKGFIYLRVEPELCYARSQKRKRLGEEGIPLSYFKELHGMHDQFLMHKQGVDVQLHNVPVLILDGSQEFESNDVVLLDHIQKILAFVK